MQGVDDLKRLVDDYFVEIIDLVYSFGGDVMYIAGDAIICVFESEGSCERAAACGNTLVHHCFPQMKLHIALAYGEMRLTVLGGTGGAMSFLLTGSPLLEMFRSIEEARADEIIVSPGFRNELFRFDLQRHMEIDLEQTKRGWFKMRVLQTYVVHEPIFARADFVLDKSTAEVARAFVPTLVAQVIGGYKLDECFTELRRVSTLFLRLDSFDETVGDLPPYINEYFAALQRALIDTGGFMRQFLMDDKGLILIAMWGVPSHSYANNALKALEFGLLAKSRCQELGLSVSVGVSTGTIFCGVVGADTRRDYVGIGDHVNFAARLMGAAKGRVLIDEATYIALPKAAQSCLKRGNPLVLKGFENPIVPYEALEDFRLIISAKQDVRGVSKWEEVASLCAEKIDAIAAIEWSTAKLIPQRRSKFHRSHVSHNPNVSFAVVVGVQGMGFYDIPQYIAKYASRAQRQVRCFNISADSSDARVQYSGVSKLVAAILGDDIQPKLLSIIEKLFPDSTSKESHLSELNNILHLRDVADDETLAETVDTGKPTRGFRAIADLRLRRPNALSLVQRLVNILFLNSSSVVIADNAHYIDESSWAVLQSLTSLDQGAVFVYLVISPNVNISSKMERRSSSKSRKEQENKDITEMYLGRKIVALDAICNLTTTKLFFVSTMTLNEIRQFLSEDLNTYIDVNLSKIVYEVTGGNPFWVRLVSDFIKEKGYKNVVQICRGDGANSLLHEIVICRFDTLSPEQQVLLKDASVIGNEFTSNILQEMSAYANHLNIDALAREGFILCTESAAAKYRFQNELMREIIYNLIPASSVSVKHFVAAKCFEKNFGDYALTYPL